MSIWLTPYGTLLAVTKRVFGPNCLYASTLLLRLPGVAPADLVEYVPRARIENDGSKNPFRVGRSRPLDQNLEHMCSRMRANLEQKRPPV